MKQKKDNFIGINKEVLIETIGTCEIEITRVTTMIKILEKELNELYILRESHHKKKRQCKMDLLEIVSNEQKMNEGDSNEKGN